ncbi:MAG: hypothetical protein IOD12_15805 [Silvanigrellales bacterium]|nr:hypothetical protein [Silvanigrellales bacterium]
MPMQKGVFTSRARWAVMACVFISTTALSLGCVKRSYNDANLRQASVAKSDNFKNYQELQRESGGEWVWMPASQIPIYSDRRCPDGHGEVAEYHLRRKNKAARWDPLWAVACIRVGKGQAIIHTGEINDDHQPSSDIIGTIHVSPRSFGWRVPESFVMKPGSGGCSMEYNADIGVPGINPSLEGNIAKGEYYFGFEKLWQAAFLPYQLLSGKECLTISGAASDNAPFFVYHGWRTENFGIVERIFIRGTRVTNRFDFKSEKETPKTPTPVPSPVAVTSAQEFPPEGNIKDTEGDAIRAETADDDLAAVWTNPLFRSWVVRDLRPAKSERHLVSLLAYPIIVEAARYAKPLPSTPEASKEPNSLQP